MRWGSYLKRSGQLKNPKLVKAFDMVDRVDFVRHIDAKQATSGMAMSIGHGQTISDVSVVAMMLQWLKPASGQTILDIGSGSGWTTALLAAIIGKTGTVIGLERIPELVRFGQANLAKYNFPQAEIRLARKNLLGLDVKAKFDAILVSASGSSEWLGELVKQLKPGGKLVIPIRSVSPWPSDTIWEVTKSKPLKITKHPGFIFVPLIK